MTNTPRRATIIDVAREAGVSFKTVARVVNDVQSVDPAMTDRVHAAIEKLGFRRNSVAANLRSGSDTATIGLIIGDVTNSFYSRMLAAVSEVAEEHETLVISASAEEQPDVQRRLVLDLCQRRVNGLIIVPAGDDHAYLAAEMKLGTPMVFIDRPPVGIDADVYLIDNMDVAAEAARRVIEQGHTRVAIVLDDLGIFTMRERLAGFEASFASASIHLDPALVTTVGHTPESTARAVRSMLASDSPPTAFLTGNNRATIGVIEELHRENRTARIVGFDDFEMSHLMPRRSTIVDYDISALAREAARQLFARIGGEGGAPQHHLQPTRFVERGLP
jgi:LacI family transcriptional regulator